MSDTEWRQRVSDTEWGQSVPDVSEVDERARRRHVERHAAAAVRAVSGHPDAEWRGQRLSLGRRRVPIATPYLVGSQDRPDGTVDERRTRGVADGLGMLLRHTDLDLHAELSPTPLLERIVFDALEQLRCDSLTPPHLRGQRANLNTAFDAWSLAARAHRVAESRTSLLVFTVIHMVNARLMARTMPEDVDELTEATRFHLAPVIGHALRELPGARTDQRAFAAPAAEIARLVNEIAGDADDAEVGESATRHRLVIPVDWAADELSEASTGTDRTSASGAGDGDARKVSFEHVGDYRIFTTEHDREVAGHSLHRETKLREVRGRLDAMVSAQAVSVPRLAARLLAMFGAPQDDDWAFGVDSGVLDARRLSQLVANPANREVFRRPHLRQASHTAVTFLVDNSGSMKRQRYEAVAVLVDTFSRALDLAGITNEVLGFTTGAWAGGRPLDEWRAAGEPTDPGRMNEALHIVYKAADARWRTSRTSLAALAHPMHFREGLDGEALVWAHDRLAHRSEQRKVLVMITDGSPTDAATANVNRPGFLDDHLAGVADRIERHRRASGRGVELASIDVDANDESSQVERSVFRRSIDLDLSGTLTLAHYAALDTLLA